MALQLILVLLLILINNNRGKDKDGDQSDYMIQLKTTRILDLSYDLTLSLAIFKIMLSRFNLRTNYLPFNLGCEVVRIDGYHFHMGYAFLAFLDNVSCMVVLDSLTQEYTFSYTTNDIFIFCCYCYCHCFSFFW